MAARGELHVLVLAAGRGRRMGGPKALMTVGGKPWWLWQHESLAETGIDVTWVVSRGVEGAMAGSGAGLRTVATDSDAPMFLSVFAGLCALRDRGLEGVFVLPVDVPAPGARVWRRLAEAGAVAVPIFLDDGEGREAGGHPVYLPWKWILENDLLNPELALTRRLDELIHPVAVRVPVDDPAVLVNINTPEDLERWEATRQA